MMEKTTTAGRGRAWALMIGGGALATAGGFFLLGSVVGIPLGNVGMTVGYAVIGILLLVPGMALFHRGRHRLPERETNRPGRRSPPRLQPR